jgi:hypothetical protein
LSCISPPFSLPHFIFFPKWHWLISRGGGYFPMYSLLNSVPMLYFSYKCLAMQAVLRIQTFLTRIRIRLLSMIPRILLYGVQDISYLSPVHHWCCWRRSPYFRIMLGRTYLWEVLRDNIK